jgi:hypothetical protein
MNYQPLSFQIKDIDNLLLCYLNYKDLEVIKLLNKKTISLFNDRDFWLERIQDKYSDLITTSKINNHKELYQELEYHYNTGLVRYAETYDCPDIIEWMIRRKRTVFTTGANLLAKHGRLTALKQIPHYLPDNNGLILAVENKQHEVVNWLIKEKNIFFSFINQLLSLANLMWLNIFIIWMRNGLK